MVATQFAIKSRSEGKNLISCLVGLKTRPWGRSNLSLVCDGIFLKKWGYDVW